MWELASRGYMAYNDPCIEDFCSKSDDCDCHYLLLINNNCVYGWRSVGNDGEIYGMNFTLLQLRID